MPFLVYPLMESVRLDFFIFLKFLYGGLNRMYMFATKGKDYFCVLQVFDRVFFFDQFCDSYW